ncbi:MAG: efflux RND transporter periplasmic adaptor subunit [Geminicoccaceae bacterium]|nr:MAG: efflux RND transporter periplasmic adaptor subunit [Geminicoccaceae bacterium]
MHHHCRHDARPDRPSRLAATHLVPLVVALALTACDQAEEVAPEPIRPVRVVTVVEQVAGEVVSLTGRVQAEDDVSLGFRLNGRMIERLVGVGDVVTAGQSVARLDPETERNAVLAARADLAAAQGELARAATDFERQATLLERGFTTRVRYDEALQARRLAQSWVDTAEARLAIAEEQLSFTALYADAPGVVTQVGAEPGEVVAAGQMVVRLARDGGRDAVFDVPERLMRTAPRDPVVQVRLATDPGVRAEGRVREVAPQADPVTRTFEVKVGLIAPPEALRLGATVVGRLQLGGATGIELPASALTIKDGRPAVFVLDLATNRLELRPVEVARHDLVHVVIASGLASGETVVTAGVQVLRPGQEVRVLGQS